MDLGHSPDTGASEGELRSGYALTPSPSHSKNISLFTERRTSERAVSKDGYSSFYLIPCGDFQLSPREFYLSLINRCNYAQPTELQCTASFVASDPGEID